MRDAVWVKVCANTTLDDTQQAIDLGADAVGFVFAPSPRRVTPEQVGGILAALRMDSSRIELVGVFRDASFEEIVRVVGVAGLTGVQLHQAPDVALLGRLRDRFGDTVTITQTLHWVVDPGVDARSVAEGLIGQVRELVALGGIDRVLVDSKVGQVVGGTGVPFDWGTGKDLFRAEGMRMVVAGGVSPENVGEAVRQLDPFGVDVASGVEAMPRRKDPERLRLFIERARAPRQAAP